MVYDIIFANIPTKKLFFILKILFLPLNKSLKTKYNKLVIKSK